jgi:DNA-binding NarL/FixJ family response regulator
MSKIRVLIVDDHPVVRRGLHSILSNMNDMQVVGEAENSTQALERTRELRPDVLVLDIRMPGSSGLQIIQALKQIHSEIKIVVLTSYDTDEHLFDALSLGAHEARTVFCSKVWPTKKSPKPSVGSIEASLSLVHLN